MRRRVQLPGASELFRMTTTPSGGLEVIGGASVAPAGPAVAAAPAPAAVTPLPSRRDARRSSGRQRHDEKITVYLSSVELLALERVRLDLRAEYGVAVDRGRLVRKAVAIALSDLEAHGDDSGLVRRLTAGH